MTDSATQRDRAISDLSARSRRTRLMAAKRLRQLKDPLAGQDLLGALRQEVQDPDTWEIQYQMIMALAESGYQPALTYFSELAEQTFDSTMLYVALGDAIVRLGRSYRDDPAPVLDLMQTSNSMLIDGALRATAMLRLNLNSKAVKTILDFLSSLDSVNPLRFWGAVAAAGWRGPDVDRFLAESAASSREDIRRGAIAAQRGRYLPVRPL
jgi:hypothetical protein